MNPVTYDKKQIEEVCKECEKKTLISYKYSFFSPRYKSIEDIEIGRSRILKGPFNLLLENLYLLYEEIRNAFSAFKKWLFPRKNRIYRNQIDGEIVGKITFGRKNDEFKPIHHLHLEVWARTKLFQWRKLGEGLTDMDGNFSIAYDLRIARRWRYKKNLHFEIYETVHKYDEDGEPKPYYKLFKKILFSKNDLIGMRYSLDRIILFFWEYRSDVTVPRVFIKKLGEDAPEHYTKARMDALYQQTIPYELIKLKHLKQLEFAPETINFKQIQDDYPINLTRCIEKKLPGYTRSDEWLGKRMMNGMNRAYFEDVPGESDAFYVKYFGVCRYDHNDQYALPTSRAKFKLQEDGSILPVEIQLEGALSAFEKDPWKKRNFSPKSGDEWTYAKRVVRVNGSFSTELDEHFTGTHLNTEQYAIAAFRNLRLSPIATLILPHLKEVSLVNHTADKILLTDFIPHVTAITADGISQRTRDLMGVQDWKNWKTIKNISKAHSCAMAEELFWKILYSFVSDFIDQHQDKIKEQWHEIYKFSEDLLENSVPVFLSDVDMDELDPRMKALEEERFKYYSGQYGFDGDAKREKRNGHLKAVSPITLSPEFDETNEEEDMQNLKSACAYMIMVASYLHTWINENQYNQLGEVLYACGGLRFGEKERGILAPESDLSISPDLSHCTQGLFLANILSRTEYGFITTNNEQDVNPELIRRLLENEEEFKKLDVDIHTIESRTNI